MNSKRTMEDPLALKIMASLRELGVADDKYRPHAPWTMMEPEVVKRWLNALGQDAEGLTDEQMQLVAEALENYDMGNSETVEMVRLLLAGD